jgi:hypothetical protein
MRSAPLLVGFFAMAYAACSAGAVERFLVTNNDVPLPNPPTLYVGNTVSFYSIDAEGRVGKRSVVDTAGVGIGGGSFAAARIALFAQGADVCVFASNAGTDDITGIRASDHRVSGVFLPSASDSGSSNGIGLAANANYLYATYSSSSTLATFSVQAGCTLTFLGDIFTVGLGGGLTTGMAIRGHLMILTYGDGSIESFDLSAGIPVSNQDKQYSAGAAGDHLPNGVVITADGRFAIFGDASTTATLEVSDISSGRLTPTVAYEVGVAWNSGSVKLSPDESLILATNNSGGRISAAFFDKTSGRISRGCTSGPLKGFYESWTYAGAAALQRSSGAGGLLYVPEFGNQGYSSIGIVRLIVTDSRCALVEMPDSPVVDNDDPATLLSIATYAPPDAQPNE